MLQVPLAQRVLMVQRVSQALLGQTVLRVLMALQVRKVLQE